jgi:formate hydrogenlyase transcriptional activator
MLLFSRITVRLPGNLRELENFIERSIILTRGSELYLPITERKNPLARAPCSTPVSTFHDFERQPIIAALKGASGRIAGAGGAAERRKRKHTTAHEKMRKLNVPTLRPVVRADHIRATA